MQCAHSSSRRSASRIFSSWATSATTCESGTSSGLNGGWQCRAAATDPPHRPQCRLQCTHRACGSSLPAATEACLLHRCGGRRRLALLCTLRCRLHRATGRGRRRRAAMSCMHGKRACWLTAALHASNPLQTPVQLGSTQAAPAAAALSQTDRRGGRRQRLWCAAHGDPPAAPRL